jgi:pimeloyl-ACP methyl ester carboxylesterase
MTQDSYPAGPGFPPGRTVPVNGIDMYVTEAGDGPPVVLCHGFPELGYSWRHQLPALAGAGYRTIVPDQRGYGRTSQPEEIAAYDIGQLTGDMLALLDHLGEERAVFVGHDWGSIVVWNLALMAPERVEGVVGMSVPYVRRPQHPPTELLARMLGDTWFYILYFQEPGVADADLGGDPATAMRRFLCAVDGNVADRDTSALLGPRDGRGMVERLPEPDSLPGWLSEDELAHYIAEFARTGFTGGLNWYRNLDRNWEITPELAEASVEPPALFIGGTADPVLVMTPPATMRPYVPDLRGEVLIEGAGHWVQQEKPDEVNEALLAFLAELKR